MDSTEFENKPKAEGDRRTYYPNRPLAMTAADRGQREYMEQGVFSATAQFEPDRGFVAVLFSDKNIPDANDAGFEVRVDTGPEATPANWTKKKAAPIASKGKSGGTATPSSGATARVHAIAEQLYQDGKVTGRPDRSKVIEACTAAGINPSTAATQWAKFAKNKGW